jgi:hypothetical protein
MENGCSIVESLFTEPLHSNGHGTDPQKTSYIIVTLLADWRADCCLATSNNSRNSIVAYVCSVARCLLVRCLAIHVTILTEFVKIALTLSPIWFQLKTNENDTFSKLSHFFFLALQPTFGPWPTSVKLSVSLQFTRSWTFGRTSWMGDQLVARPLPVHKHRKTHIHKH